jgi:4-amino-4-deoxy-L-arabinose transferase-like glycosyltransferase
VRLRRLALFGVLLATTFLGLFDHDLWAPDEPRAAELGHEFLFEGRSWAVPTLNGRPFVEKPPLVYWTIAVSLNVFGVGDGAARVPCILFAWGTLLFVWLLARRLYGGDSGEASALVTATTAGFLLATHHVESDVGLIFFTTGAAYFLRRAFEGSSWWYGAAALAALGAFFSKGFIGFVFPGLLWITWIFWTRSPRELLRARPWIWLPLLAIPITAWLCALRVDPRGDLLRAFWVENHLDRFLGTRGDEDRGQRHGPWYYLLQLPVMAAPWIVALGFAARWIWSRRAERPERFLLSWFLAGFLFLSVAGTKRAIYLVPLLPPLAILIGGWISSLHRRRWLEPAAVSLTAALGMAWFFVVSPVNEKRTFRPFCRKMERVLPKGVKLYGYDADETTRAVVPFYTGRNFQELSTERQLDVLASEAKGPVAVITVDVRGKTWHSDQVRARFPNLWLGMEADRPHRLQVFCNVPLR